MSQLALFAEPVEQPVPEYDQAEMDAEAARRIEKIAHWLTTVHSDELGSSRFVLNAASVAHWSAYDFKGVPVWGERFKRLSDALNEAMDYVHNVERAESEALKAGSQARVFA